MDDTASCAQKNYIRNLTCRETRRSDYKPKRWLQLPEWKALLYTSFYREPMLKKEEENISLVRSDVQKWKMRTNSTYQHIPYTQMNNDSCIFQATHSNFENKCGGWGGIHMGCTILHQPLKEYLMTSSSKLINVWTLNYNLKYENNLCTLNSSWNAAQRSPFTKIENLLGMWLDLLPRMFQNNWKKCF